MLVATFGASTGWVGKTITHEGDKFVLEGFGPITAHAVLDYDTNGQLDWAYSGLREWVQQVEQADRAALTRGASTSSTGQPHAQQRVGVAGFVLSIAGFIFPITWLIGLVLCWLDLRRAKRESLPRGLALAGLIISSIGTGLIVVVAVAIPMFLAQRDRANESAVKEGIHSIQVGVESWAIDHGDAYPDASQVSKGGLDKYVDIWPTNAYTGLPMTQGAAPGGFTY